MAINSELFDAFNPSEKYETFVDTLAMLGVTPPYAQTYRECAYEYMTRLGAQLDEKYGILLRPNTWDFGVAAETRTYLPLEIDQNDICLDIGGNIGTFALLAVQQGSTKVLSIEPDPQNYAMLLANTKKYTKEILVERLAVVGDAKEKFVEFYINASGKNKALHSTVEVRGRPHFKVPAVGFETLMKFVKNPTVLKIDIEGGEYDFDLSMIPDSVTKFAIEWHLTHKGHRELAHQSDEFVRTKLKFDPVREFKPGEKNWTSLAIYRR